MIDDAARVRRGGHRGPRRRICLADEVIDSNCGVESEQGIADRAGCCRPQAVATLGHWNIVSEVASVPSRCPGRAGTVGACIESGQIACRAGPDASCNLREVGMVQLICPTCQSAVAGRRIDHSATLHGVVFDIFASRAFRRGGAGGYDRRLHCRSRPLEQPQEFDSLAPRY